MSSKQNSILPVTAHSILPQTSVGVLPFATAAGPFYDDADEDNDDITLLSGNVTGIMDNDDKDNHNHYYDDSVSSDDSSTMDSRSNETVGYNATDPRMLLQNHFLSYFAEQEVAPVESNVPTPQSMIL
jgi:hypothetical protein